jgi:hypothetical protein
VVSKDRLGLATSHHNANSVQHLQAGLMNFLAVLFAEYIQAQGTLRFQVNMAIIGSFSCLFYHHALLLLLIFMFYSI